MNALRLHGARRSVPPRHSIKVRRGSWISLFAMLMIFIGPLISQAMPMDHAMPMSLSMSMDGPSGEPGCHGETASGARSGQGHGEQHALWEKCGYCSLLFNCPALPGSLSFTGGVTPPDTSFISPSPRQGHARQTVFPGARTRAPPAISQAF